MRALIVDDDVNVAKILRRHLTAWGWETDVSTTVADAIMLFKEGRYDLALCDVDLPDGDGISLASVFLGALPSLSVIIASGDPKNLERAQEAGFARCLEKPFSLENLKALLEEALKGRL
ncbi:MAG: response regulator [Elusimicrobiota bacterium]